MKKRTKSVLAVSFVIAFIAGGILLVHWHVQNAIAPGYGLPSASSSMSTGTEIFSGNGYVFGAPAGWRVEQGSRDVMAAYPGRVLGASVLQETAVACKIEMSVFPYSPSESNADWISSRISADPSLIIAERSSEDVVVNGGTGVRWSGFIDDAPTTLVYAFSNDHAYEIAPSVLNGKILGNDKCGDALDVFLSHLTIQ